MMVFDNHQGQSVVTEASKYVDSAQVRQRVRVVVTQHISAYPLNEHEEARRKPKAHQGADPKPAMAARRLHRRVIAGSTLASPNQRSSPKAHDANDDDGQCRKQTLVHVFDIPEGAEPGRENKLDIEYAGQPTRKVRQIQATAFLLQHQEAQGCDREERHTDVELSLQF